MAPGLRAPHAERRMHEKRRQRDRAAGALNAKSCFGSLRSSRPRGPGVTETERDLADCVGAIYEAATGDGGWLDVGRRMCRLLDAQRAMWSRASPTASRRCGAPAASRPRFAASSTGWPTSCARDRRRRPKPAAALRADLSGAVGEGGRSGWLDDDPQDRAACASRRVCRCGRRHPLPAAARSVRRPARAAAGTSSRARTRCHAPS